MKEPCGTVREADGAINDSRTDLEVKYLPVIREGMENLKFTTVEFGMAMGSNLQPVIEVAQANMVDPYIHSCTMGTILVDLEDTNFMPVVHINLDNVTKEDYKFKLIDNLENHGYEINLHDKIKLALYKQIGKIELCVKLIESGEQGKLFEYKEQLDKLMDSEKAEGYVEYFDAVGLNGEIHAVTEYLGGRN